MAQEKRVMELVEAYYEVQNSPESAEILEELDQEIEDLADQRNLDPEALKAQLSRKYCIDVF